MDDVERPLTTGEGGPYGALAARPMPPGLAVIFMPSLAALRGGSRRPSGARGGVNGLHRNLHRNP